MAIIGKSSDVVMSAQLLKIMCSHDKDHDHSCIVAPVRQFSILNAAVRAPDGGLVRVVYISKP